MKWRLLASMRFGVQNPVHLKVTNSIYRPDDGAGLYQEMSFDEHNDNPATIEIENPTDLKIQLEEFPCGKVFLSSRLRSQQFASMNLRLHG
jgi:hypothetical protein